jgi:hypothetical protein
MKKKPTYKFLQTDIKPNWFLVLQDCPTGYYFFVVEKGRNGISRAISEVLLNGWNEDAIRPPYTMVHQFAKAHADLCTPAKIGSFVTIMQGVIGDYFKTRHVSPHSTIPAVHKEALR